MKNLYKIMITVIICAILISIGLILNNYISHTTEIVSNVTVKSMIISNF